MGIREELQFYRTILFCFELGKVWKVRIIQDNTVNCVMVYIGCTNFHKQVEHGKNQSRKQKYFCQSDFLNLCSTSTFLKRVLVF
mmetsp:Transcript_29205/g.38415  ORF Transcript_29205/g.38415 Transcript_29205/m.38415 type:complete len:84 (-) Transcript_29205:1789-2040(-)